MWLRIHRLPAYAPDLNPAEGIWSLLKRGIANFAAAGLDGVVRIVKRKLRKTQYRPHLINGCLTTTGLTIEPGNHMHYEFKLVIVANRCPLPPRLAPPDICDSLNAHVHQQFSQRCWPRGVPGTAGSSARPPTSPAAQDTQAGPSRTGRPDGWNSGGRW